MTWRCCCWTHPAPSSRCSWPRMPVGGYCRVQGAWVLQPVQLGPCAGGVVVRALQGRRGCGHCRVRSCWVNRACRRCGLPCQPAAANMRCAAAAAIPGIRTAALPPLLPHALQPRPSCPPQRPYRDAAAFSSSSCVCASCLPRVPHLAAKPELPLPAYSVEWALGWGWTKPIVSGPSMLAEALQEVGGFLVLLSCPVGESPPPPLPRVGAPPSARQQHWHARASQHLLHPPPHVPSPPGRRGSACCHSPSASAAGAASPTPPPPARPSGSPSTG